MSNLILSYYLMWWKGNFPIVCEISAISSIIKNFNKSNVKDITHFYKQKCNIYFGNMLTKNHIKLRKIPKHEIWEEIKYRK
jgi:hypothetical protein